MNLKCILIRRLNLEKKIEEKASSRHFKIPFEFI